MERARRLPWNGIKQKALRVVKSVGTPLIACALLVGLDARATSSTSSYSLHDTDTFPRSVRDRELPNIEARQFEVKPLKMSESNRAYLFEDISAAKPGVGRIILLKQQGQPVMALRVLRTFPESKRFIAKRVRRYKDREKLDTGQMFVALERINEIPLPASTGYSAEDERDMQELADLRPDTGVEAPMSQADFFRSDQLPIAEVAVTEAPTPAAATDADTDLAKLESELDTPVLVPDERAPAVDPDAQAADAEVKDPDSKDPTDPGPEHDGKLFTARGEEEDDVYDPDGGSIDEVEPLDHNHHGLSGQFGFLRTSALDGTGVYYKAGGIRYGLTLGKQLLLSKARLQDDLTLEGGLFMYSIADYSAPEAGDAFNVISVVGTLRYTIYTSDTFGVFFYGGMMRNNAKSTGEVLDTDTDSVTALSAIVPAVGGGMLFRMGPGWELRTDLGADMIAMGLMLRF